MKKPVFCQHLGQNIKSRLCNLARRCHSQPPGCRLFFFCILFLLLFQGFPLHRRKIFIRKLFFSLLQVFLLCKVVLRSIGQDPIVLERRGFEHGQNFQQMVRVSLNGRPLADGVVGLRVFQSLGRFSAHSVPPRLASSFFSFQAKFRKMTVHIAFRALPDGRPGRNVHLFQKVCPGQAFQKFRQPPVMILQGVDLGAGSGAHGAFHQIEVVVPHLLKDGPPLLCPHIGKERPIGVQGGLSAQLAARCRNAGNLAQNRADIVGQHRPGIPSPVPREEVDQALPSSWLFLQVLDVLFKALDSQLSKILADSRFQAARLGAVGIPNLVRVPDGRGQPRIGRRVREGPHGYAGTFLQQNRLGGILHPFLQEAPVFDGPVVDKTLDLLAQHIGVHRNRVVILHLSLIVPGKPPGRGVDEVFGVVIEQLVQVGRPLLRIIVHKPLNPGRHIG